MAECKCPMCKQIHFNKAAMQPSNGTRPWIYCDECRAKVPSRSGGIRDNILSNTACGQARGAE